MITCQKCCNLVRENNKDTGYYYCPNCKEITYFFEYTSK